MNMEENRDCSCDTPPDKEGVGSRLRSRFVNSRRFHDPEFCDGDPAIGASPGSQFSGRQRCAAQLVDDLRSVLCLTTKS